MSLAWKFDPTQQEEETLDPKQEKKESPFVIAEDHSDKEGNGNTFAEEEARSTDAEGNNPRPSMERVAIIPKQFKVKSNFKILQKFEGTLTEITDEECHAIIRDLTMPEQPKEEIVFSIEEISESDKPLAIPGGIFYWSIGYEDRIDGQRRRVSAIRFQRVPEWSERDIEIAKQKADHLIKRLGWMDRNATEQRRD